MRRLAPELLLTARTQRWRPEELLRTLVEAEIAAREASNTINRRKAASFPVEKSLEEFDVGVLLDPARDLRLPRLPGVGPGRGEPCPGGPRRHRQVPPARRARARRGRSWAPGPLLHRRRARRSALPRPRGQLRRAPDRSDPAPRPDHHRRDRVRPARRHRRPTAVPPRRRRLRTPLTGDQLALALRAMGPVPARNTPPRSACSTGSCTTPTSSSPTASPTACAKPERRETTPAKNS